MKLHIHKARITAVAAAVLGIGGTLALSGNTPSHCAIAGNLPDAACTPGVVNQDVTQSNIQTTICESGWTSTVRPPVSYTTPLKEKQISQYGYTNTTPSAYEEDHYIPLEAGGNPTDPRNLWPEPIGQARHKDKVENYIREKICSGSMTLAQGQAVFQSRQVWTVWNQIGQP